MQKKFGEIPVGLACLVMTLLAGNALAQTILAPQLINYQGRLTDAAGNPVTNGSYGIEFRIWNDATSGDLIWGPQYFTLDPGDSSQTGYRDKVPVVQGYFNAILGEEDIEGDLINTAFNSPNSYIEITVDGGSPVLPRQRVLSAPFAVSSQQSVTAEIAEIATDLSNIVPSGMIAPFALDTCPSGWVEYEPAYGRFVRGVDRSGESRDPDGERAFGSIQLDLFAEHDHSGGYQYWQPQSSGSAGVRNVNIYNGGGGQPWQVLPDGGAETRPINVALLYCAKL